MIHFLLEGPDVALIFGELVLINVLKAGTADDVGKSQPVPNEYLGGAFDFSESKESVTTAAVAKGMQD